MTAPGAGPKLSEVKVEKVTKIFGRHRALGGVSVTFKTGLCVLLGPNGAGKSTLLGVLASLVRPSTGRVVPQVGRDAIGLLAHDSFVYGDLDANENLRFWGSLYSVTDLAHRVPAILDEVGLETSARTRPARTYSRGMLQRLALARALLSEPSLLLLDEPFTGLDRGGTQALVKTLVKARQDGRIVVVITHDLEAVSGLCDHLVILKNGKIATDERTATPLGLAELRERYQAVAG